MTTPHALTHADAVDAPDRVAGAERRAANGRIHLHVDRLVLRGIDGDQGRVLIEQLTASLRRRWVDGATAREWGRGAVRARPVARGAAVPKSGDAAALGEAFADALAREILR